MATSDLERFLGYVQAFELAFMTGSWEGLEPLFHEDARHVVHHGGPFGDGAAGRTAVIADLRASTSRVDARFDVRIPEIVEGPLTRPDGIWMRWVMTMRRAGVPELRVTGDHLTVYEDGRIRAIEEWLAPETPACVEAFLAEQGTRLRPEGSPFNLAPSPADARDLDAAVGRSLARCYGHAKSEQDIEAALTVCSPDFLLETVSLGVAARGRDQARAQLAAFFTAFPDYRVTVDGLTSDPRAVACWGTAHMTFAGPLLGLAPTGKGAELPFVSIFAVGGGALAGERFLFDAATLCAQIGLPLDALHAALAPLRADAAVAARPPTRAAAAAAAMDGTAGAVAGSSDPERAGGRPAVGG